MLLYRCFPRIPGARRGRPGHWSFVPSPQTRGRWDNADLYDSWYFSQSPVGAIAESFYNKQRWIPEVFLTPTGQPRALAICEYDERRPFIDLDDAPTLTEIGVRPSQVVIQDPATTQSIARKIYQRSASTHAGLTWWSSQAPAETSVMLWGQQAQAPAGLRFVGIEPLSVEHPAVADAAAKLYRVLG